MQKNHFFTAILFVVVCTAVLFCGCVNDHTAKQPTSTSLQQTTASEPAQYVRGNFIENATTSAFRYARYENGIVLTRYIGEEVQLVIPNAIQGAPVCEIDANTFTKQTRLQSVEIPANVCVVAEGAFASCTNLQSITVSDANLYFCSVDGVLYDHNMQTLLVYPAGKTDAAFSVPETVQAISDSAFYGASYLQSILLPASVQSFGRAAFASCHQLQYVECNAEMTRIPDDFFNGCTALSSFDFPPALEEIGARAFQLCAALQTVSLPDTLTAIGDSAFGKCTELRQVSLPETLIQLGSSVFSAAKHGCTACRYFQLLLCAALCCAADRTE